jgi:hypothetical protein
MKPTDKNPRFLLECVWQATNRFDHKSQNGRHNIKNHNFCDGSQNNMGGTHVGNHNFFCDDHKITNRKSQKNVMPKHFVILAKSLVCCSVHHITPYTRFFLIDQIARLCPVITWVGKLVLNNEYLCGYLSLIIHRVKKKLEPPLISLSIYFCNNVMYKYKVNHFFAERLLGGSSHNSHCYLYHSTSSRS